MTGSPGGLTWTAVWRKGGLAGAREGAAGGPREGPWWLLLWFLRWWLARNFLSQPEDLQTGGRTKVGKEENLQAKGRSLVCVRVCFLRSLLVVKSLGQAASRQLKVLPGGRHVMRRELASTAVEPLVGRQSVEG